MADSLKKNPDSRPINRKLKESGEYYSIIFNNVDDIIAVFNEKIECEYINEVALMKTLGYNFSDIKGNKAIKIVCPDDSQKALINFHSAFKNGRSFGESRVKCKDGSIKWIQSKGYIFTKDGERKLILISRDISEQKKIEKGLIDEKIELEKLNELKSEFLRRTTHELKIPLTAIKGYTDLLLEINSNKLDPEMISNLENIQEGCSRLEHIIKNIIESSKIKTSKIKLRKSRGNLSECIRYCLDELKELSDSKNHSIKLHIKKDLVFSFDKEQVCEVLINLLSNAMKYTPVNGILSINTESKNNFVIVSIKDNGIGITKEEKKKLFKEFGKINHPELNLDSGIEGSGLGLYISKQIIELHDGEIWVESEGRNKGSTFYFSLPIKKKK